MMTICIPTMSDSGATAILSPRFESAPYYTLVDLEASWAQAFPNPCAGDEDRWDAAKGLDGWAVDAVVCKQIGLTALEQLRAHGIPVLATEAGTVAEAVRAFREVKVSRLTHSSGPGVRHPIHRNASAIPVGIPPEG
ncbi:MAG: NifB/NifX family molybdenum-iron cluster-binding protein [Gemmatimonadota bacterium]